MPRIPASYTGMFFFISHKTLIHITSTTTVPLIAGKDTKSASSHNE